IGRVRRVGQSQKSESTGCDSRQRWDVLKKRWAGAHDGRHRRVACLRQRRIGSNGTPVGSVSLSVATSKGERAMWKKLLIVSVAATGLFFAVADAQARHSTHKTGVTTHSRAALHARAQTTPQGWHHGKKVGWHSGSPPAAGCKPPGLRNH